MTEPDVPAPSPLRVAFVPGVMPDTWARRWRERVPRVALELLPVDEVAALAHEHDATGEALALLAEGRVDMALVRLPVDEAGHHVVRLYEEVPVVVVPREHPVAAYEAIDVGELADEHLLQDPDVAPPLTTADMVATIGAGTGIAILPMSLARLHARKDVVARPVHGVAPSTVALVWPRDASDDRTDYFVGIVRGRTANSSRSPVPGASTSGPGPGSSKRAAGRSRTPAPRKQRGPRRTGRR